MGKNIDYIDSLIRFMDASPCNFLAINEVKRMLEDNGYTHQRLDEPLKAEPGAKFFITKNDSALMAFKVGKKPLCETGFKVVAAHSDSPCFRVKPHAEMAGEGGILRLNTEVYGGPILYTWFDRPLSLAGRVILKGDDALHPVTRLLKIDRPLMCISHLAIHFNRAVNEGNKLSKQTDMLPIMAKLNSTLEADGLLLKLVAEELKVKVDDIEKYPLARRRTKLLDDLDAATKGAFPVRIDACRPLRILPRVRPDGTLDSVTILSLSIGDTDELKVRVRNAASSKAVWQDAKMSAPKPLPCAPGAASNEQVVTLANMAGWQGGTIFFE